MYQKRKTLENAIILMIDVLCLLIGVGVAFGIRFHLFFGSLEHGDQIWQVSFVSLLFTVIHLVIDFNHHFFRRGYFEELIAVIKMQAVFAICWVVSLYAMHRTDDLSRAVFGYYLAVNVPFSYISRILLKQYMVKVYKKSKYSSRTLLITTSARVEEAIQNLLSYNEWNRILKGIVLLDRDSQGDLVCGFPIVAGKENVLDYVVHNDIDEVFILASNIRREPLIQQWVSEMELMGIIVDVNIDIFDIESSGKRSLNRVGKYAVVTFARNIFSTRQMVAKRALDVAGSLVGMMILGIAAIFVAPAIKLESPGPVFFGQTRIGRNGRRFTFYKFRSMYQDAEERKKELMASNEVKGLMFKMENDPRITRVGQFIRKTSIDELPQFWNVLKGDMSLVGTRPPTVDEFEHYESKHKCRLSMTPGMTGLWQISGRSDIKDFDEVVKLDMQYIDNWSILLDIKIILLTVGVVFRGKGSR